MDNQPVRASGADDETLAKLKGAVVEAERILVASGVCFPCEVELKGKTVLTFDRKGGQFRIILFNDATGEEKLLADASVAEKVEALPHVPRLYDELARVRNNRMIDARLAVDQFANWARSVGNPREE